jgi:hypothetical protein
MYPKKNLVIFILFLLLLVNIFCYSSQARSYLFNTDSSLTLISSNISLGTLMPEDEVATSEITIKYEYGRLARPQGFPIPNRKETTTITLAIESMPSWCEVSLDKSEFQAPIGSFLQKGNIEFNTTLTAKILPVNVTAFSQGKIVLNATAVKNGNVMGSSNSIELTISPDFLPGLVHYLSNQSLMLDAEEEANLSLFVENKCNSDIIVEISANISKKDIVAVGFPTPRTIKLGEQDIIPISIRTFTIKNDTSKNVDVQLFLSYRPLGESAIEYNVEGPSLSFFVVVSEESDYIDLTSFVIGIVVVFIVLYFIFTLIVWRRRS